MLGPKALVRLGSSHKAYAVGSSAVTILLTRQLRFPSHLVPWSRHTSVCSRAGICTQASLTQGYLVFCFSS